MDTAQLAQQYQWRRTSKAGVTGSCIEETFGDLRGLFHLCLRWSLTTVNCLVSRAGDFIREFAMLGVGREPSIALRSFARPVTPFAWFTIRWRAASDKFPRGYRVHAPSLLPLLSAFFSVDGRRQLVVRGLRKQARGPHARTASDRVPRARHTRPGLARAAGQAGGRRRQAPRRRAGRLALDDDRVSDSARHQGGTAPAIPVSLGSGTRSVRLLPMPGTRQPSRRVVGRPQVNVSRESRRRP